MSLKDFFDYKNRLMQDLCKSREIVTLVTDNQDSDVPNHTLPYSQVFPYEYIPETVNDGQTFICFDVDIASVENKTFYIPVLYIWAFTHKSKFRLNKADGGGVRIDRLCAEIDKVLNGSRYYGLGTLDLVRVERFSPILDYQGRVMVYTTRDFNRFGSKTPPSNRKTGT